MKKLYDDNGRPITNRETEEFTKLLQKKVGEIVKITDEHGFLERHVEAYLLSRLSFELFTSMHRRFHRENESSEKGSGAAE